MVGNELTASFSWTDNQLAHLGFSRNDRLIAFTEHQVDLTFKDPRGNGEIEKILLDPQYRPGNASNADFWVETTITSPVSNKKVSETALCYWNNDKSIAVGSIEDDGGRLAIVAESVTDSATGPAGQEQCTPYIRMTLFIAPICDCTQVYPGA